MKKEILDLGRMSYDDALEVQLDLHQKRVRDEIPDTLILVEHEPVMTVGRSGGWEFLKTSQDILESKGIVLRETDRGGKITYHSPGQLVGYPILKIKEYGWSPPELVDQLQKMLISVLSDQLSVQ